MPLKLSLKPGERFVVNGAVLQNGDRRAVRQATVAHALVGLLQRIRASAH